MDTDKSGCDRVATCAMAGEAFVGPGGSCEPKGAQPWPTVASLVMYVHAHGEFDDPLVAPGSPQASSMWVARKWHRRSLELSEYLP